MFKCQNCGTQTRPGEKLTKVITESVVRDYPHREKVYEMADGTFKDDPGGRGTEIVKEISVCPSCAPAPAPEDVRVYRPRREPTMREMMEERD